MHVNIHTVKENQGGKKRRKGTTKTNTSINEAMQMKIR